MNIDEDILVGLSEAELEALADSMLAPTSQARLDELLALNSNNQIGETQRVEPDQLIAKVDQLTILKTRARFTLSG